MANVVEPRESCAAEWGNRFLRFALIALSVVMVMVFLAAALKRMRYPYEYDWIEDGVLMSVLRLRQGLPLYSAPDIHFTPYLYTPLYIWLAAMLSHVTGIGYNTLRLLSTLSSLGCFAVIYAFIFRETRRHYAAFAGVGLFAACYTVVGGAYDLGRVDTLWMFLVLCAIYATRRINPLVAAALWTCAFQAKQGVLPMAMLLMLWQWRTPRRVVSGVGGFIVMLAASIAWMAHSSGCCYLYYVFGMAGGYGFNIHTLAHIVPADLLSVCGIALVLAAAVWMVEKPEWNSAGLNFYLLGSIGLIGFTSYLRAHRGANTNAMIPAYAWASLLFGVALARLCTRLEQKRTAEARAVVGALLLAALVQIGQHYYSPMSYVSTAEERAARDHFEAMLRSIPGDVMVVSHPQDGLMAGKQEYAGSESAGSVIEAKAHENGDKMMADYESLIGGGTLSAVVLDSPAEYYLALPRAVVPHDFLRYYPVLVTDAGGDLNRFTSEPKYLYFPCPHQGKADTARQLDAKVDESACTSR